MPGTIPTIAEAAKLIAAKQLSLLHEFIPNAAVVGFLLDQNVPDAVAQVPSVQEAARKLGLQLIVLHTRTATAAVATTAAAQAAPAPTTTAVAEGH